LAKSVLLTLYGSRAVYFIRHRKSNDIAVHLHCSRRHTFHKMTENQ